jgi:hypothetical protein
MQVIFMEQFDLLFSAIFPLINPSTISRFLLRLKRLRAVLLIVQVIPGSYKRMDEQYRRSEKKWKKSEIKSTKHGIVS